MASDDSFDLLDLQLAELEHLVSSGEFVPGEVVNRLVHGENPIRVWREHRGLSLRELARRADVSAQLLSEIENEHKNGSLRTLRRVAHALRVDLDDLAPPEI